ncbi:MAG: class I SAM-dependent methyltransferase [Terriglobales bacterium]
MSDPSHLELPLAATLRRWCAERSARDGFLSTFKQCFAIAWQYFVDSLPSHRRRRYGDVGYDWDHRVDTTGATVGWRDRLLGLLHSPYQPTDPALFREMMANLSVDCREFVFIDIGSGKGRVLLMAADHAFKRIVGVELLPELHRVAQENVNKYKSDSQGCFAIQALCGDARKFIFPTEPTVLYLFNPLPEPGLERLLANLEQSLREHPRPLFVLYHNPMLEHVLARSPALKKVGGTHQYSIFIAHSCVSIQPTS